MEGYALIPTRSTGTLANAPEINIVSLEDRYFTTLSKEPGSEPGNFGLCTNTGTTPQRKKYTQSPRTIPTFISKIYSSFL